MLHLFLSEWTRKSSPDSIESRCFVLGIYNKFLQCIFTMIYSELSCSTCSSVPRALLYVYSLFRILDHIFNLRSGRHGWKGEPILQMAQRSTVLFAVWCSVRQ